MSVRILGISGTPRKGGSSDVLLEQALEGARSVQGVETTEFYFAGKKFEPCNALCVEHCSTKGICAGKDDFQSLFDAYMQADGVIWSFPVYHVAPNAQVKCVLDRLCNVIFMHNKGKFPRLYKACTALTQGSSRWGGQEIALQFMVSSFVLMNCIPVSADMPQSYLGTAGHAPAWELGGVRNDEIAMETAKIAGIRVAETTKIIQCGLDALKNELPDTYYELRAKK